MVNIGDLGQDLAHCLQLCRQLREFRGVWAGVRGLGWGEVSQRIPHWGLQLSVVTQPGLWGQVGLQVSAHACYLHMRRQAPSSRKP